MDTSPCSTEDRSVATDAKRVPFAQVLVTLTKQEHIELVCATGYWRSAHERSLIRMRQLEREHSLVVERWRLREVALRGEFELALAQSNVRVAALQSELELAQAQIRDLKKRVYGRKSERGARTDKASNAQHDSPGRSRGQQPGTPGHGRRTESHLPARIEPIELSAPCCPCCGLGFDSFPGTEDSEVLEIDVKAYRRVIRRRRYLKTCGCSGVPTIITAPAPARLIARGKYGISVWVHLLLSKFAYGQPSHRLLQELSDSGLRLSEGTLTGGLQAIAPLFAPLEDALLERLRGERHWHADETRWMVSVEVEGKIGHRWYLWVFQSASVVHYVLDPSRSANVPIAELGEAEGGIVSCDRYSAYKKFVRLHPLFTLAFCWAHQRRDYLELANSHPALSAWALSWVDRIGALYRLNNLRLAAASKSDAFVQCDHLVRQEVSQMSAQRDAELANTRLAKPAAKVLRSMQNHWPGLTVFVDHPEVPMDNSQAERSIRPSVVGRKNFYGSGSVWSGELTATMYSLLMTVKLWGINPRTWLNAYLHACAENGNRAPQDLDRFLPWCMDARQLVAMKEASTQTDPSCDKGIDSS